LITFDFYTKFKNGGTDSQEYIGPRDYDLIYMHSTTRLVYKSFRHLVSSRAKGLHAADLESIKAKQTVNELLAMCQLDEVSS